MSCVSNPKTSPPAETVPRRFRRRRGGVSSVSYALLVGLVAVIGIAVLALTGQNLDSVMGSIADRLADPVPPPEAQDDSARTSADLAVSIDVLANDSPAEFIEIASFDGTTAAGGQVSDPIPDDGALTYTPPLAVDGTSFTGDDSFAYIASAGGESAQATVTITVDPILNVGTVSGLDAFAGDPTLFAPDAFTGAVLPPDGGQPHQQSGTPPFELVAIDPAEILQGTATVSLDPATGATFSAPSDGLVKFAFRLVDANGLEGGGIAEVNVAPTVNNGAYLANSDRGLASCSSPSNACAPVTLTASGLLASEDNVIAVEDVTLSATTGPLVLGKPGQTLTSLDPVNPVTLSGAPGDAPDHLVELADGAVIQAIDFAGPVTGAVIADDGDGVVDATIQDIAITDAGANANGIALNDATGTVAIGASSAPVAISGSFKNGVILTSATGTLDAFIDSTTVTAPGSNGIGGDFSNSSGAKSLTVTTSSVINAGGIGLDMLFTNAGGAQSLTATDFVATNAKGFHALRFLGDGATGNLSLDINGGALSMDPASGSGFQTIQARSDNSTGPVTVAIAGDGPGANRLAIDGATTSGVGFSFIGHQGAVDIALSDIQVGGSTPVGGNGIQIIGSDATSTGDITAALNNIEVISPGEKGFDFFFSDAAGDRTVTVTDGTVSNPALDGLAMQFANATGDQTLTTADFVATGVAGPFGINFNGDNAAGDLSLDVQGGQIGMIDGPGTQFTGIEVQSENSTSPSVDIDIAGNGTSDRLAIDGSETSGIQIFFPGHSGTITADMSDIVIGQTDPAGHNGVTIRTANAGTTGDFTGNMGNVEIVSAGNTGIRADFDQGNGANSLTINQATITDPATRGILATFSNTSDSGALTVTDSTVTDPGASGLVMNAIEGTGSYDMTVADFTASGTPGNSNFDTLKFNGDRIEGSADIDIDRVTVSDTRFGIAIRVPDGTASASLTADIAGTDANPTSISNTDDNGLMIGAARFGGPITANISDVDIDNAGKNGVFMSVFQGSGSSADFNLSDVVIRDADQDGIRLVADQSSGDISLDLSGTNEIRRAGNFGLNYSFPDSTGAQTLTASNSEITDAANLAINFRGDRAAGDLTANIQGGTYSIDPNSSNGIEVVRFFAEQATSSSIDLDFAGSPGTPAVIEGASNNTVRVHFDDYTGSLDARLSDLQIEPGANAPANSAIALVAEGGTGPSTFLAEDVEIINGGNHGIILDYRANIDNNDAFIVDPVIDNAALNGILIISADDAQDGPSPSGPAGSTNIVIARDDGPAEIGVGGTIGERAIRISDGAISNGDMDILIDGLTLGSQNFEELRVVADNQDANSNTCLSTVNNSHADPGEMEFFLTDQNQGDLDVQQTEDDTENQGTGSQVVDIIQDSGVTFDNCTVTIPPIP